MNLCENCRTEVTADDRFCPACGQVIDSGTSGRSIADRARSWTHRGNTKPDGGQSGAPAESNPDPPEGKEPQSRTQTTRTAPTTRQAMGTKTRQSTANSQSVETNGNGNMSTGAKQNASSGARHSRSSTGRQTKQTKRKRQPNQTGQTTKTDTSKQEPTSSKSNDPLLPNEEVLVDTRPGWSAWFRWYVLMGLLLIGAIASSDLWLVGGAIGVDLLILGVVGYLGENMRYVVTNYRVIVVMNLSTTSTNEAWMADVRGLQTGASALERVLGHGHVSISTSILPRGSMLPMVREFRGMTLGGLSDHKEVANVVRDRQGEIKHGRQ